MKISVLTDNIDGNCMVSEHGLSLLIEHEEAKILYDSGQSNAFLRNAVTMNIGLDNLDFLVLSHGHYDHGNGLQYLNGGRLICHPGCFVKRYRKSDNTYIGLHSSRAELERKFEILTTTIPYKISKSIFFLGEIPRETHFESTSSSFILEDGSPDFIPDDSAVAVILPKGLFVITGCGHSGIVNILEYSKKITGVNKIYGIMGGFHMKTVDSQVVNTVKYLLENNVKKIIPMHCVDTAVRSFFQQKTGITELKTGDTIIL